MILGVRDLDVGCEDRIGGGEDRAEEDRGAEGKTEPEDAGERDQGDGDRHRAEREPERQFPEGIVPRNAQLQPGGEKRDDDGELGETFDKMGVVDDVDLDQPDGARSEGDPDREVDERRREGKPLEDGTAQRHDDEKGACDEEEQGDGHGSPFVAFPGPVQYVPDSTCATDVPGDERSAISRQQ